MGAEHFEQLEAGEDIGRAFHSARDAALYEHGHGGYTGSLAEKDSYVVFDEPRRAEAAAYERADELLRADPRIDDKHGPAGVLPIRLGDGRNGWLFFGMARC